MSGRPESNDSGGYGDSAEQYDATAWQDFTPWRPGDPSTASEAPANWAASGSVAERRRAPAEPGDHGDRRVRSTTAAGEQQRGRWWTEEVPRRYEGGDRIRSTQAVGGEFISHVPAGTEGRVVERRTTLFGEDRLTVQFANGYTEKDIKPQDVKRDSWW